MDSGQRHKYLQQLLRLTADPEKRRLAIELFASPKAADSNPPKPEKGLSKFWSSTPVWGALGVLIGAVASHISLKLLAVGVWGVLWAEFVRSGVFSSKMVRRVSNTGVGLVLALLFIWMWPYIKPRDQPTLDQQMELLADKFARKFPLLASTTPQSAPVVPVAITQGTVWMADSFFSGFYWIHFYASNKITPINVLANYTITNIRPVPITIKHVSLEILGAHNTWWPLANLPTRQPIWSADRVKSPTSISLIDLPDGFLIDKLGNTEINPGHSVGGWMLCQLPSDYVAPRDRMSARLRLRVKDTADEEAIQPLQGPITSDDNVLFTSMKASPVLNDNLMKYEVVPYSGGSNSF